jgi:arylsulfatase A-like enzyme
VALLAGAALFVLPIGGPSAQDAGPRPAAGGPNVLIVMTDDQRFDDMAALPVTSRLIGGAGVTFQRSYASYPVCCPARATLFTGQYAQNHDVRCLYPECGGGYGKLDQSNYLPVWLERAGYATAHIGKFLNGYGKEAGTRDLPRGWTEWYGLVDHSTYRMWGYKIHEKGPGDERGTTVTYGKRFRRVGRFYQTDVLTNKAVSFIRRRAPDATPFFLSVAYLAPHHESGKTQERTGELVRAHPKHRGHFAHMQLPKPPSFNEPDMRDKPSWVSRYNRPVTAKREAAILERRRQRWESLLSVDEGVARIIRALRRSGELDNTYVIFTSDQGFMQGEHRIAQGKMVPYDPSTHVPLLVRGPGIPRNRVSQALVGDVDIAPTILDAASARASSPRDGRSFLPFARSPGTISHRPLLHTTAGKGAKRRINTREGGARGVQTRVPAWKAVRTVNWLYVEYRDRSRELYDVRGDPWQLRSLVREPDLRVERNTLRRVLQDLSVCRGSSCEKARFVPARRRSGRRSR